MKKKMIFASLLAGMSFATPSKVEAQGPIIIVENDVRATFGDVRAFGIRFYGCWCAPMDCMATVG